jgi:hypothetical protein
MNPKSTIEKGKLLEKYVAEQIESYGLGKARRAIGSGSGNREKADIDTDMMILGVNAGIECKNHKVPHIKDWWEQTKKLETVGREPVLVYSLWQETLGDSKAVISLDTLLRLIKASQAPKTPQNANTELTWAIKTAITALKKVFKLLGGE